MLRDSVEHDLPAVLEIQSDPDVARWVTVWTPARHRQAMREPDDAHMVFCERERTLGFLLLAGLTAPDRNIELRRIALAHRGQGIGAPALELALGYAFEILGARRVWLDVVPSNQRALRLYARSGLTDDGIAQTGRLLPDGTPGPMRLMSISSEAWASQSRRRAASS